MSGTILLIEDDSRIQELISLHVSAMGLELDWVADGQQGLEQALANDYALLILDLNLPSMHGIEICRKMRNQRSNVPILMLTSQTQESDKVLGLDAGADDYLAKPFGVFELCARIRALLRRKQRAVEEVQMLTFAEMEIDLNKRKVILSGQSLDLSSTEFELLVFLAEHPGRPFTREQLLRQVLGYESTGYENTVNSHINRLRAKVETDPRAPRFVKTVWGIGYRFAELEEL